jgi:hypothetical protein
MGIVLRFQAQIGVFQRRELIISNNLVTPSKFRRLFW